MKLKARLVLGLLFLILLDSCTKQPDITPRYTINGEGYFKNYYFTDSIFPNISLSVYEEVVPDYDKPENYQIINRGVIKTDSKGHYTFSFKVYDFSSQFDISENQIMNFNTTNGFPNNLKDTGINHFNFYFAPSGVTAILAYDPIDSYPIPWDSIHLTNPYDTNIIFRWIEGGIPSGGLRDFSVNYGQEQFFSVLPGMPYKIVWKYYKNHGQVYNGKEIDYLQAPLGTNTSLTLTF
jgi:hypothetical protein